MRVYERYECNDFNYPEDMKNIIDYLNEHGKILVSNYTIENLYCEFSDERYCAGWMSVDDEILEEFEEWLMYYDI